MIKDAITTTRVNVVIAFLITGLPVSPGFAFSQEPNAQSQTTRPTVQLSLRVRDSRNAPVDDVTKDEVQLIEDDQPQVISRFEKDTRPTQYVIAVDTSGSFRGLLEPALDFVKLLIRGMTADDEIQLIRFISSDKIEMVQDFTSEQSKLADSLKLFKVEMGQSAVVDAIYEAVRSAASHRRSESIRRAVVLISDGEDRTSYYTTDALVKLLRTENVQVFVVGIVINLEKERGLIRTSQRDKAETLLKTVASESGGRVFFPRTNGDLVQAAAEINHDLHNSYLVGFQPANVDKKSFRNIKVKITSPRGEKLKAVTRSGYFIDAPGPDEKGKRKKQSQ